MYQPLLSVDLTRGRLEKLDVPVAVRRRWIGGTGLGIYLLSQEIWPGIRASDPECPAFILTGPLTGTQIPQSSDWVVVTVNADLPTHVCASHCHGYLGARLRQAGWDGIVIEGKADKPVWVDVRNEDVKIKDARHLWGLDTWKTQEEIWREALVSPLLCRIKDSKTRSGHCSNCRYLAGCKGCRSRTFVLTGDWFAADPCCPLSQK